LTGHSINVTEGYLMSVFTECFYYCSPYAFRSACHEYSFFQAVRF
jgi:hypothetical protein